MTRIFGLIAGIMMMAGAVWSQPMDSLLSLKQRATQQSIQNWTGDPIVYFGPTVGVKTPQKPGFVPMLPSWRPEVPQVQISLPFGENMMVPNVLHIPYFLISVQLLTDGTALVREDIQLIIPEGEAAQIFNRQYETQIKDKLDRSHTPMRLFVEARHNGQSVPFEVIRDEENGEETLIFHENSPMMPGVHTYQISYQIPGAVFFDVSQNQIFLSLLGRSLPYLTERLVIWLNLPKLTPVAGASVLFGTNNQTAPNVGSFLQDEEGNVIFKLKGILPSQTDVRLDVWTEKGTFEAPTLWDRLLTRLFHGIVYWIACVSIFVIWLYYRLETRFSKGDVMDKTYQNKMSLRLSYQPVLMRFVLHKKTDNASFVSLILGLANKGYLKIQRRQTEILFLKTRGKGRLTRAEKAWMKYVFGRKKQMVAFSVLSPKPFLHHVLTPLLEKEEQRQLAILTGAYRRVGWFLWLLCGAALYFAQASLVQAVIILGLSAGIVVWGQHRLIQKGAFRAYLRQSYEHNEAYWRQPMAQNMTAVRQEAFLLRRLPYEAALQLPILEGEKTIQPIWLLGEEKQFYLTSLVKELLNKMVYLK